MQTAALVLSFEISLKVDVAAPASCLWCFEDPESDVWSPALASKSILRYFGLSPFI